LRADAAEGRKPQTAVKTEEQVEPVERLVINLPAICIGVGVCRGSASPEDLNSALGKAVSSGRRQS